MMMTRGMRTTLEMMAMRAGAPIIEGFVFIERVQFVERVEEGMP